MQKQTLSCANARHLAHLAVGDDTLPEEEKQLAEHLHACSECRAYHAGTMNAMHILQQVRDEDSVDIPAGAVWSAISERVKSRRQKQSVPEKRPFNGVVAALCACSLTLALVTVVQSLPVNSQQPAGVYAPAMGVSMQPGQSHQAQPQLVAVSQPDGTIIWVDTKTGQTYVPDLLSSLPNDPDTTF